MIATAALPEILTITVCASCLRASCWKFLDPCPDSETADSKEVSLAVLRQLEREDPKFWNNDLMGIDITA